MTSVDIQLGSRPCHWTGKDGLDTLAQINAVKISHDHMRKFLLIRR